MKVTFSVLGPPVGKQRARVFKDAHTQKMRARTPKKTRVYQDAIASVASLTLSRKWPLDRRYRLRVKFTGRCDADNVLKSVSDALEGVAYDNDRQVDDAQAERMVMLRPCTEVTIEVLP